MVVPQSLDELQEHLQEQIAFLHSSIAAYDAGAPSEAKRLAVALRVLLHDTPQSRSLLGQLGLKDRLFYDSSTYEAYNERPWDVAVYTGLLGLCISIGSNETSCVPALDHTGDQPAEWVDFDTWWNMVVIRDEVENTFSRRDLVLTMANRDGGAHVDPVLTTKYAMLSRQHSLGWQSRIEPQPYEPIPHPERVAVRQIAHEVLKSLDPSYTKDANVEPPYFVAYNVLVMYEPLKKKFEVNEPCPCGSGKKYKKCHGAPTTAHKSS
jgi:hypothetical protein